MNNLPQYFKVLWEDGRCYYGGDGKWIVGEWRSVTRTRTCSIRPPARMPGTMKRIGRQIA